MVVVSHIQKADDLTKIIDHYMQSAADAVKTKEVACRSLVFSDQPLKNTVCMFPFDMTDLKLFAVYKIQSCALCLASGIEEP